MHAALTIIILTENEEDNLPRCLDSIAGFGEIVVVDSGSSDRTIEIAKKSGAPVYEHAFAAFGQQRNWALDNCDITTPWVLFMDADEAATPEFRKEVSRALQSAGESMAGFYCCWKTMIGSRWLKHSDSFPKWQFRILRRGYGRFIDSGHGQKEGEVDGQIGYIEEPYLHFAFSKGWDAWWAKHKQYSIKEAADRLERRISWRELFSRDPSRRNRALKPLVSRVPGWPFLRFLHMYILKRGFLEGGEAFTYCRNIARYESMIGARMAEMRRRHDKQ